jgi:hypothetical protein
MINSSRPVFFLLPVIVFLFSCSASKKSKTDKPKPYTPVSQELYAEIAHMDSVLFNAFNSRDTTKFKTLFTDDLEFYHDKNGLIDYTFTVESLKRTAASNTDLKRELIPGSLEVYPIKDYGAVQIGMHRFCHTENGKPDCGTFKFVHIWKKENGEWKISRVVSYDH